MTDTRKIRNIIAKLQAKLSRQQAAVEETTYQIDMFEAQLAQELKKDKS